MNPNFPDGQLDKAYKLLTENQNQTEAGGG